MIICAGEATEQFASVLTVGYIIDALIKLIFRYRVVGWSYG